jgi:hypothetical protein
MSAQRTEDLVRELAGDLSPVRRIPSLRVVAAGMLAAWLVGLVLHRSAGAGQPRIGQTGGPGDPVYLAILVGWALVATGGIPAALARAVPGREPIACAGALVLALGLLLASAAAALGVELGGEARLGQSLPCLGRAALLALAPGLVACAFLARAWGQRPLPAALALTLAAVALGALAVHASCVTGDGLHRLLGHVLGPALAAGLLALPIASWLRSHPRR